MRGSNLYPPGTRLSQMEKSKKIIDEKMLVLARGHDNLGIIVSAMGEQLVAFDDKLKAMEWMK